MAFTKMMFPVTIFVRAWAGVARAPPMFIVIPTEVAIEVSVVMVVALTKVTCFQTAVMLPLPPLNSTMFPVMALEKLAVALVMVVVPTEWASVVEIFTVDDWQLEQAAAFLLSNWDMSVPVAPATNPPPLVLAETERTSQTVLVDTAAAHCPAKSRIET